MATAYKKLMKLNNQERLLDDEDPMTVIERRLAEVKQMTKRREQRQVLAGFPLEIQQLILKYKDLSVAELREERRKKCHKLIDRFRRAVAIVRLLLRGFNGTTKYYLDTTNVSEIRKKMETMIDKPAAGPGGRASISFEMQTALTTQPHLRTKSDIKQILWILRATKAFKHLFPAEMETEVARMVAYERYDDGRILAYQGRTPDRFYYTLSGRVNLLRQYKLSTGHVTKSMGFLTKGYSTDPQEVDMQWMREDSLVAKGQVEVLLFDKKSFRALQHTTEGPPLEFLQSLHLFLEFPVQRFLDSPDAIEVKYFGQGKIVVKDSNRTPWIHVVKSGLVKVVRRQTVVDVRLSNESKFTAPTIDHLGCGKPFSHAEAMLGVQAKQKKTKVMLPQMRKSSNMTTSLGATHSNKSQVPKSQTPSQTDHTSGDFIQTPGIFRHNLDGDASHVEDLANDGSSSVVDHRQNTNDETFSDREQTSSGQGAGENFEPHDLWLTREKTKQDAIWSRATPRKATPKRRAYLQLDLLKPGDVFGLDHLQPTLASEPVGVSLLSDGAEVIKISKRFFLQNAENNTMLKVETMYKEYLSEKEAKDIMYHKETWDQYKSALWCRMTAPSPVLSASRR